MSKPDPQLSGYPKILDMTFLREPGASHYVRLRLEGNSEYRGNLSTTLAHCLEIGLSASYFHELRFSHVEPVLWFGVVGPLLADPSREPLPSENDPISIRAYSAYVPLNGDPFWLRVGNDDRCVTLPGADYETLSFVMSALLQSRWQLGVSPSPSWGRPRLTCHWRGGV